MISNISNWAGSIVISVIIVTILEMLLPEGKNKKYIKTVMSVYILFIIISPVIKAVTGKEIKIEDIIQTSNQALVTNNTSLDTSSSIKNIYLNNLKKDVYAKLEQKGYKASDVNLVIETSDEDNYGKIYEISVVISKIESLGKENKGTNKVETVKILVGDTGLKKELSNENTITDKEKEDLKEYLSNAYDVKKEKITIKEG